MKKIQLILFSLLLGATSIMISSCAKDDPCKNVTCGTNGQCAEGVCICDEGYEKDAAGLCNTEIRAKLIASYTFVDVCTSGTYTGNASIEKSSGSIYSIVITNFAGVGPTIKATATVDKNNKITIPDGTVGAYTLTNASGTYDTSTNKITWSYNLKDSGGVVDVCTSSVWTKL